VVRDRFQLRDYLVAFINLQGLGLDARAQVLIGLVAPFSVYTASNRAPPGVRKYTDMK
jgi:hypothetical protein